MNPIKNADTQAKCVELAAMVKAGRTVEASADLRKWVAERPGIMNWEVIAIQDQVRYLAR